MNITIIAVDKKENYLLKDRVKAVLFQTKFLSSAPDNNRGKYIIGLK